MVAVDWIVDKRIYIAVNLILLVKPTCKYLTNENKTKPELVIKLIAPISFSRTDIHPPAPHSSPTFRPLNSSLDLDLRYRIWTDRNIKTEVFWSSSSLHLCIPNISEVPPSQKLYQDYFHFNSCEETTWARVVTYLNISC